MNRLPVIVLAAASLAVPSLAAASGGHTTTLRTHLSGRADVPRGPRKGRGTARLTIRGNRLCWRLSVHGTDKPRAAQIHKGNPGEFGALIVSLGHRYKSRGCEHVRAAVLAQVAQHPESFYLEVHTRRFPTGAVRGQLR
jgi:CHRD domain-containing protein